MSYYMGDYYAGDPGIGSFFGGLVKKAVSFIPGVGPGISALLQRAPAAAAITGAAKGAIAKVGTQIVKHPVLSAAGAAGVAGVMGAGVERMAMGSAMAGGARARGFHPCKSKRGCKSGAMVRNRHMNVCNPRALRRAIRRARGFTKLAMRTIHLTHPKKKGRFGGFKTRRRK